MKKNLVTVLGLAMLVGCMSACGTNATTETTGVETFSNDDFSLKYSTDNFESFDARGAVQFSYVNEEVDAAGSNVVIITKEESSKVDDILNTITESREDVEGVYDSVIGAQEIPAKIIVTSSNASEESGLKLVDNIILMQSGEDVISVESIRTVGPNEETEMTIDGAFNALLESFELN